MFIFFLEKVSDILDFHSEIQFSISLSSLEELYFNKLRNTVLPKKPVNKLRWDEFRDLNYQSFSSNPKFLAEQKFFQYFIKRLSKIHFKFFIPIIFRKNSLKKSINNFLFKY